MKVSDIYQRFKGSIGVIVGVIFMVCIGIFHDLILKGHPSFPWAIPIMFLVFLLPLILYLEITTKTRGEKQK